MPFKSKKQERYLQINEPEIYQDWVEKYGRFKEAESFNADKNPYYEVMVDSSTLNNLNGEFDGVRMELNENLEGVVLSLDYGEGGDEPSMTPSEAKKDYMNQISITTYYYEPDADEITGEWYGEPNTNIWRGTINFPEGKQGEGGEFYLRVFGFKESELPYESWQSRFEAEKKIMDYIQRTVEVYVRERDEEGNFHTVYEAESFGAEPDTIRFKVGERYTPIYYHGYGHSDIEIIRRTDKSVFVAQVDAQGNAAGNTLRYKIYTTPAVDIGGDRFPAQEYYKLTHGQPVRAGDTTKKAESFNADKAHVPSYSYGGDKRSEFSILRRNPDGHITVVATIRKGNASRAQYWRGDEARAMRDAKRVMWIATLKERVTQYGFPVERKFYKRKDAIEFVFSTLGLTEKDFDAESFRSYKVAPDLSSYTKAELVSSIAGPQGTAAYDEVVYDPIAQSRLSAETATQRFKNYGNSLSGDTVCPACGDESWDEYLDGDEWRGYCGCGHDFDTGSALENPLLTFYEMEALKEQGKLTSDQKEYLEWRITSTLSDLDSSSRNKKYIQDELVAHGWTLDRWGNAEPPEESVATLVGNAESIDSFSPARLIILGASIGVALGLYNTRGE